MPDIEAYEFVRNFLVFCVILLIAGVITIWRIHSKDIEQLHRRISGVKNKLIRVDKHLAVLAAHHGIKLPEDEDDDY